ncbi:MAG: lysylphosphatidylglycerol synthase transmembrane domain-containing protein [Candidatus Binataceae bacterium]
MEKLRTTEAAEHPAAADGGKDSPARRHPYRGFALRGGLGVGLLGFLAYRFGASAVFSVLSRERPGYFLLAIAIYTAGQVMSACRWQLLAAVVAIRGRFSEFLAYYFLGMFTNLFVPGIIGGDAARAFYLGRRHGRLGPAAASVVADRGLGLLSLLWLAAAVGGSLDVGALPSAVVRPVMLIGAVSLGAFLAAPLIARAERLMPHSLARHAGLITPYLRRPLSLLPAIILSLILQALYVIGQYVLALGLGVSLPLSTFLICVPVAGVFASIPVTFGGLGLRESAYTVLFGMVGLGSADAIALGLLWFASTVLVGLTGIVPFLTTEIPVPSPAQAAQSPGLPEMKTGG